MAKTWHELRPCGLLRRTALGIIGILAGISTMANSDQGALNPAQATAAIAAFFAREGPPATPDQIVSRLGLPKLQPHPDLGPLVSFRGSLGTLWVSARGNVVYYTGKALRPQEQNVDAAQGFGIAKGFAERQVADFLGRNFAMTSADGDADSFKVRWTEQPRREQETAIFPNWVEVVVAIPSGRVTRFSASDLRLVRSTPPAIAEAEARTRIRARFAKASIEEIELMQVPRDNGTSGVTVWTARVMTLAAEGPVTVRVTLDADTGEVLPE